MYRFRQIALLLSFLTVASAATAESLHHAAAVGDLVTVNQLLDKGADPDMRNKLGETALTSAIIGGQAEAAILLLDRGAAMDARNAGGFTPLHAAAYSGLAGVAKMLLERGADIDDRANSAGVTSLSIAAEENRLAVARALTNSGAAIEIADKNGYTPLTRAVWRDHDDMARLLVDAGARCQPVEIMEEPAHGICLSLR